MLIPVFLPHFGCNERCSYCDQGLITDLKPDQPSSSIGDMLGAHEGPHEIGLFGGNIFGLKPFQLRELFRRFDKYENKISNFRISTKPNPLDAETINILKENRVTVIELGCPTFNNTILTNLGRNHTSDDVIKAHAILKGEGFNVALQCMAGLPGETMTDMEVISDYMSRVKPAYIRIYPLVIFSGTPMGEDYMKGAITLDPLDTVLDRVVFLYLNVLKRCIPVARIGLSENEIIREHVLGGNYHPAYGYVVKSKAFYLSLTADIKSFGVSGSKVTIFLNSSDIPHLIGDRRTNLNQFAKDGILVQWKTCDIPKDSFVLEIDGKRLEGNVLDALKSFEDAKVTNVRI